MTVNAGAKHRSNPQGNIGRRHALKLIAAAGASTFLGRAFGTVEPAPVGVITRAIPSSGERIPVIGLGSWRTFNVGDDPVARAECAAVMRRFFEGGGRLIDSSPMYGSSQDVIGEGLAKLGRTGEVFSAEKVWTSVREGADQIERTREFWRVPRFDLLQVHNLQDWEKHLPMLRDMKSAGKLRYVGITTSHGRRTEETEQIMRTEQLDFVQVTYNIRDRELEERLLPLAQDRGIAVIINRPFQEGALIRGVERRLLPPWAGEIGCENWAQFLLKFVVSHPAVTCAIPATSVVEHVAENMGAARGPMPDEAMRRRMIAYVEGS
ncbi:MAG TPA: aldo/keto reductase [Opitutaceae bacterium]|nr:aldo/keto reductase [Opitutaceae bacterium]